MDAPNQARTAVDMLTPLVHATTAEDMTKPTPCSKWAVRDLINHVTGGGHMFAASLRGETIDMTDAPADLVGDDPIGAYDGAIAAFSSALAGAKDLSAPAVLPFATVPADVALRIAAADILVHSWDLATATGQRFDPPEDFVNAVEPFFHQFVGPDLRSEDIFGDPVEPPAGATPIQRLVAFAGRQP